MPKTGLKTFVYSFSVSLFAIFAANGVYWHDRPSKTSDLKISSKNITLFLKDAANNPSHNVAPVKKIALSVLPELKHGSPSAVPEDEIIMADDFDLPEIPLELSLPSLESPLQEKKDVKLAENAAPKPTLIRQETQEPPQPDKIVIPLEAPQSKGLVRPKKAEEFSAPESLLISEHPSKEKQKFPNLLLATNEAFQNETPSDTFAAALKDEDADLLLPLEKSGDNKPSSKNIIKVAADNAVNQVALADKSIPVHSMEKNISSNDLSFSKASSPSWESMADSKTTDSPWLVAKADGALKNQKISEEAFYQQDAANIKGALSPNTPSGNGVKVASETVKNLLIPIPEDILNDENLTPQLSYTPKETSGKEDAPKDTTADASSLSSPTPTTPAASSTETKTTSDEQKNKLLASLDAIFSASSIKNKTPPKEEKKNLLSSVRKKIQKRSSVGKIMPTEMRLSFQPNRAEISGQTLRWIQAFATKAAENNNMTIEIRIDGTSAMDLQQKRLNLLHNILTDKGVEYSKINTVFTQREPNSFIIKTITHNNQKGANGNLNKASNGYYIQW